MTRIRLRAGAPDGRKADSVATTGDPRFGAHCPDGAPTHDGEAVMNGHPANAGDAECEGLSGGDKRGEGAVSDLGRPRSCA